MIFRGTLVPYYDLHFRGRYDSPLRMTPDHEMHWFPIKYRPDDLGVDGIDIHAKIAFEFDGDSYRDTWRSTPGSASAYVRWYVNGVELQQELKLELNRLYDMAYWLENWKHHCYYKNSRPESVKYYLPEILKKVHCPQCLQLVTKLVMPYDASSSGWVCINCDPAIEERYQYRKRQDESLKRLIELGKEGKLSDDAFERNPE